MGHRLLTYNTWSVQNSTWRKKNNKTKQRKDPMANVLAQSYSKRIGQTFSPRQYTKCTFTPWLWNAELPWGYCRIFSCTSVMLALHNARIHNLRGNIVSQQSGQFAIVTDTRFKANVRSSQRLMSPGKQCETRTTGTCRRLELNTGDSIAYLCTSVSVHRLRPHYRHSVSSTRSLASTEFWHARARSVITGRKLAL